MRRYFHKKAIAVPRLWGVVLLIGVSGFAYGVEPNDVPQLQLQPQGLNQVGVYALREIDPNLTGEGVRVGVVCRSVSYSGDLPLNDYQPNIGHVSFDNAKMGFYDSGTPLAGVSPHATAICSILFGEDPAAATAYLGPFHYQGAVPGAEASIYELVHFGEQYIVNQVAPPLDVVTMSFGFQFENWWTRGLEALAEHEGLIVVAGIGNGTNVSDPPLYPGAGSNTIGVGVVSSVRTADPATSLAYFSLAHPAQSSFGPTDDGRCKPDLVAPGNCLVADPTGRDGYEMSGDWSSYATPVTAGVVSLLVQAARLDENIGPVLASRGGNCVLKAILMNSATKLPYWHKGRLGPEDDGEVPLDYVQGAGMVNAVEAYRLLKAGRNQPGEAAKAGWDLNDLDDDRTHRVYRFVVDDPADKMLAATLVWHRHYSREFPFKRIPNSDTDLRLEVWAVDPANSNNDILLDYCDSKTDNVEHIYTPILPGYNTYDLVVSYSNTPAPDAAWIPERYGLAWSVSVSEETDGIFWYDLNGDGVVDEKDIEIFLENRNLGHIAADAHLLGDINADGTIDESDLAAFWASRTRTADSYTDQATN